MIDHVSLGTTRFEDAIAFYSKCFAALGFDLRHRTDGEAAFGVDDRWSFWLYPVPANEVVVGARGHIAMAAPSRESVVRFLGEALSSGAAEVRPAGERPDISPDYFGAIVRDLDGHMIEVVYWNR